MDMIMTKWISYLTSSKVFRSPSLDRLLKKSPIWLTMSVGMVLLFSPSKGFCKKGLANTSATLSLKLSNVFVAFCAAVYKHRMKYILKLLNLHTNRLGGNGVETLWVRDSFLNSVRFLFHEWIWISEGELIH